MPRSLVVTVTAAAVAVGAAYALSPMSVWFVAASAILVWFAVSGLDADERRWVRAIVIAALAVRVLLVAWLFLWADPFRVQMPDFVGDATYMKERALWLRNVWLGIPIGPKYLFFLSDQDYGWTGYTYVLAYLQVFIGPALYGANLFNVILFVAGAVGLHRVVRPAYGPAAAAAGLMVLLFMPSLVIWSSSALKESFQFVLTAALAVATMGCHRADTWRGRIAAAVVVMAALASLQTVRAGAATIAIGAVAMSCAARFVASLPRRAAALVLVAALAIGLYAVRRPDIGAALTKQLGRAATIHRGHVWTRGNSYRLLDEEIYYLNATSPFELTPPQMARFVVRGLVAFVVVPLPWQVASDAELGFLPQQTVWYVLVALAVAGALPAFRRDPPLAGFLAGYILLSAPVIALNGGNIGTLVRVRDMVVPFIVWLSALGAVSLVSRRPATAAPPLTVTPVNP